MRQARVLLRHAQMLGMRDPYGFVVRGTQWLLDGTTSLQAVLSALYEIPRENTHVLQFYIYRLYRALLAASLPPSACLNRIVLELLSAPGISDSVFQILFAKLRTEQECCDFDCFCGRTVAAFATRRLLCGIDAAMARHPRQYCGAQITEIVNELNAPGSSVRKMHAALSAVGGGEMPPEKLLLSVARALEKKFLPPTNTQEQLPMIQERLEIDSNEMWLVRM